MEAGSLGGLRDGQADVDGVAQGACDVYSTYFNNVLDIVNNSNQTHGSLDKTVASGNMARIHGDVSSNLADDVIESQNGVEHELVADMGDDWIMNMSDEPPPPPLGI